MIFLYVGLALLVICGFIYALFKWIIPASIKRVKANKEKKEKALKEIPDEIIEPITNINPVEKSTKGSHEYLNKEEVIHSDNYHEVAYLKDEQKVQEQVMEDSQSEENSEDADFERFLKNLENSNNKNIKTQIKSSSTKLKAIIMSGALQDKKYKD